MEDVVKIMAQAVVDYPDEVEVEVKEGNLTTVYEPKVAKEDVGRVIGKHGQIAHSLRTILNAAATELNKRLVLDIIE